MGDLTKCFGEKNLAKTRGQKTHQTRIFAAMRLRLGARRPLPGS